MFRRYSALIPFAFTAVILVLFHAVIAAFPEEPLPDPVSLRFANEQGNLFADSPAPAHQPRNS